MIANPNGKHFGISIFLNGRKISFSWELGKKKDATKHDIMNDFLRELIEIWVDFNFTGEICLSPNTTFIAV